MTWPRVRGLNYSTMGRAVRADIFSGDGFTGRAWHLPPTSWRIENADGEPTYIENDTDEYRRADDAVMVHAAKSPNRMVATVGATPSLLLRAYTRWLPSASWPEPRLVASSQLEVVEVHGRAGWHDSRRSPRT